MGRCEKSQEYKGVYQRKNGTWFYRYKRIFAGSEKPVYYQRSGFKSAKEAYEARMTDIHLCQAVTKSKQEEHSMTTFGEFFMDFLENGCESETSRKKYYALYNAQLKVWENRVISTFEDSDIEVLLLSMALNKETYISTKGKECFRGYSDSYISSFRKMLRQFFKYVHSEYGSVFGDIGQNIDSQPQKLRLLSLFSGMGAPERALQNIGIDYELVNFCEWDRKAAVAYTLLHKVQEEKNLVDVNYIDQTYCDEVLPDFDIMVLGSPCQDFSKMGKQKGVFEEDRSLPSTNELYFDEVAGLSRSGNIYRALQIALWKKPKFILMENVAALIGKTFESEFNNILWHLQNAGYNIHFEKFNSSEFGVPQNRSRVFLIGIRDDLDIGFTFPEPVENCPRAEEWFEKEVAEEYYLDPADYDKLERANFTPFFDTDIIHCITTRWGTTKKKTGTPDPYVQQNLIKDSKGIRCLSSEELMRFQGFEPEDAKILWDNGYTRGEIGHLIGNSITVQVLEAIFRQFVLSLKVQISADIVPTRVIKAKVEREYIEPLFRYMGNKYELLPYIDYLLPSQMDWLSFYDLFAGSATIGINVKASMVVINELNPFLYYIYKGLSETPPEKAWELVEGVIKEYDLPLECKDCPKRNMKKPKNAPPEDDPCYPCKKKYWACRKEYNKKCLGEEDGVKEHWYWGLALVYCSYNTSHVKHNKKGEYNSPFGNKKCSISKARRNFFPFANYIYSKRENEDFVLSCKSYEQFEEMQPLYCDVPCFLYLDPPYYISTATYNEDWKEEQERGLYDFLDRCTKRRIYWMLSNVIENNGLRNEILIEWLRKHQGSYRVYFMQKDYKNCMFNRKNKDKTVEVIVTNYKAHSDNPFDIPTFLPPLPL